MKRIITLILAMLMCVACIGFTACGGNELVVYTEAGFAPFEYMQDGKIVGADVEIMEKVAKKLDKTLKFENVNFDTIIDAVNAGKLTNVGAAGLSITEERKEKVDFSVPYYTANLYVIYKVDKAAEFESTTNDDSKLGVYWDAFAGKKVGVQAGTTADLFLGDELKEHFKDDNTLDWTGVLFGKNAQKVDFTALSTAVADIGLNIDAVIIDELPAKQLVKGKADLKCSPLYYKGDANAEKEEDKLDFAAIDEYAIAVTKGKTEILNAINEVLNELLATKDANGNNGVEQLVMKHLGVND